MRNPNAPTMRTTKKVTKQKQVKRQSKTLMLRLTDQHTLLNLDNLQKDFMCSQSSKAIVKAINEFKELKTELLQLQEQYSEIRYKYDNLKEAIEKKQEAEKEIADILKER